MTASGGGPRLAEAHLLALKAATRLVLAAHGKGAAAAAACRLNEGSLSECASIHHPDRTLPVDVALQLELMGESTALTAAMAMAHGCVLVPVVARGQNDLGQQLARLGREAGDVFAAGYAALADGQVTEAERCDLVRELGEMIAVAHAVMGLLALEVPMKGKRT
jgi:hypothetical protein